MKKLVLSLFVGVITLMPSTTNAQAFEQGKSQISLGYGFSSITQAFIKTLSNSNDEFGDPLYLNPEFSALGPIFAKFEYGVSEKIGFGVNIAYADAEINYTSDLGEVASIKWWNTSVNARVNRHFGYHDKFDPYIGLGMGYKFGKWTSEGDDDAEEFKALIPLGFETTFGTRIMFTQNIGLYTEVGLAKAFAQFGINAKF
tara:strand:+ start:1952 stop:2551 length:600 start_codon:yes stop_codon:yes gene_type:complete